MKDFAKKALPDVLAIVGFLIIAFVYFFTPLSEGLVLGGHDTVAGLGQGHEQQLFHEATGETTRWTGSIFSGMPTYQIAPSYGPTSLLGKIGWIIGLFTTGPLNYIFIYLFGFYILMRSFNLRPAISALGSMLWAFSSYFFIIIAAGHIWKVNTLGFIPPTIAGLVLAYNAHRADRPRWMQGTNGYLLGALVTALFTGLQVLSNHLQMTYYFLFPMAFIVIAYGVEALIQQRKAAHPASASAAPASSPAAPTSAPAAPASSPAAPASSPAAPTSAPAAPASASVAPTAGSRQFGGFGGDFQCSPLRHWLKATAAIIVGGLLGAAINLPNLYHTYDYSRYSMRGPSELTTPSDAAAPSDAATSAGVSTPSAAPSGTGGLDRSYITQWSYGIDETMTLLIPMYKGGGSASIMDREGVEDLDGYSEWREHAGAVQEATQGQLGSSLPGLIQYWGDQPFTVGPVYVGAIVCFLFLLGLFVVRGPMKWALLFATILSLLFAWGKNLMPVTDFFIDHLPMYNKFRTVSSALVIAEFTMPFLGILGLAEVLRQGGDILKTRRGKIGLLFSFVFTAGLTLMYALVPSLANPISTADAQTIMQLQQMGLPADFCNDYRNAILHLHESILAASALRSFLLIVVAGVIIGLFLKFPKSVPAWSVITVLFVVSLVDMWNINRNYLNDNNFETEFTRTEGFSQTPADKVILADKSPDYRVLNLSAGNPFNESDNHTAYWHKSIGGYHAAKLHRYQDLIDRYLNTEVQSIAKVLSDTTSNIITRASEATLAACSSNSASASVASPASASASAASSSSDPAADPASASAASSASASAADPAIVSAAEEGRLLDIALDTIAPVLNMLNARWLIAGQGGAVALRNTSAQGNAWFLTALTYVSNASAEIAALKTLDLRTAAVADARFQSALGDPIKSPTSASAGVTTPSAAASTKPPTPTKAPTPASAGVTTPSAAASAALGEATLTSYAPNELRYTIDSKQGGVVAFSEVYYPGWSATIDGQPAELGRVNYILRALRVPAGKHEVIMTFHPATLTTTNAIAYSALALLLAGLLFVIYRIIRRK